MAPTWNKSRRVWISADPAPAESSPAPLSVGPGSGKRKDRVGENKKEKRKGLLWMWSRKWWSPCLLRGRPGASSCWTAPQTERSGEVKK